MEDNISKLVQIAGGILIGVILLSLVSFFFSSIGLWPAEEDQIESAEQIAKFNLEYEVYEKNGMYGVDVISCLNKAKSNNEKYVEGGAFLINTEYGKNFYVDVWVNLNSEPLKESITVYHFNDRGTEEPYYGDTDEIRSEDGTLAFVTFEDAGFKVDKNLYTQFKSGDHICKAMENTFDDNTRDLVPDRGDSEYTDRDGVSRKYYTLLDKPGIGESENNLVKLVNLSNKTDTGSLDRVATNTDTRYLKAWSRVVWKTTLSDFKTRRFKCDFIGYSEKTARVNKIIFSEI